MAGHQEYASFDFLPPGLCPCRILAGGVVLHQEGRGYGSGPTHRGADAESVSLRTVRGRCARNPEVIVQLTKEEEEEVWRR